MNNASYSILVMSDDGYSFLWEQYFDIMFKAWKDILCPIYVCARTKKYDGKYCERVQSICVGAEPSWSKRFLTALDNLQTPYVLLALDDFYLEDTVRSEYVKEAEKELKTNSDVAVVYLQPTKHRVSSAKESSSFREMNKKAENYLVTTQMGLWRVEALRSLIRSHETPWEFESYGSKRAKTSPYRFLTWNREGFSVFTYDWGKLVRERKWDIRQVEKLEKIWNIEMDLCGIDTYTEYVHPKSKNPVDIINKVSRAMYQKIFHSKWHRM